MPKIICKSRERAQVVKLPEIEVIGARSLEALVEQSKRSVAGAVVGLRGQKNLAATLAQSGPVVIKAAGIGRCRVAVGHALIERAMDDGNGLADAAVRAKHPFATQGKLGHLPARAPQETAWNRPGRSSRRHRSQCSGAGVVMSSLLQGQSGLCESSVPECRLT